MKFFLKKILRFIILFLNKHIEKEKRIIVLNNKEKIKKKLQSVGYNLRLNGDVWNFSYPNKIIIGNNVHIGNNFYANALGGICIGDNTHISRNVTIYSVNHDYKGIALPYDDNTIQKPVFIGKNVWIGMNVSISPGVTIGDGAIIGIGTVVNKDVKPLEIVVSPEFNMISKRNVEYYNTLEKNKNYGGINGKPLLKNEISSFLSSYQENRMKPIVFILGTGRSGTTSMVNILNQHPKCKAFHESTRQLIRLSTKIAYAKDLESKELYFEEIKSIFKVKTWEALPDQILIHSDQRFWNLVPFFLDYFPNSKFIHLIREPISSIKSMIYRNWYKEREYPDIYNHDWAKYRIQGDKLNSFSKEEWESMSNIQRCVWYWVCLNNHIQNDLNKILDKNRVLKLKLEDLSESFDDVIDFLQIEKFNFQNETHNKGVHEKYDKDEVESKIVEELKKYTFEF